MSRSKKKHWVTDNNNTHAEKKVASRRHRHNENITIKVMGDLYIGQPSKLYTNPWDICDYKYQDDSKKAGRK